MAVSSETARSQLCSSSLQTKRNLWAGIAQCMLCLLSGQNGSLARETAVQGDRVWSLSENREKSYILGGELTPLCRSSRLWDMSCPSRTWHLKPGLRMIHRQQLQAPLSLCLKVLMLKVKPCTSLLGLLTFCKQAVPQRNTHGTPTPPCLACLLWGCCTCHARGGNFKSGLLHPSAKASVGTQEEKRDM